MRETSAVLGSDDADSVESRGDEDCSFILEILER
jgi:hypothetical protein